MNDLIPVSGYGAGKPMTPKEVVEALDRYIIGQDEAKRSVAVALRNRYRRSQLPEEIQKEITPKNILMVGPTGVGKTEIARRLAMIVGAPFIKVEATKYTEVGYVGRDVESMVRDLIDASIRMVREEKMRSVQTAAARQAESRLVDILANVPQKHAGAVNPLAAMFGGKTDQEPVLTEEIKNRRAEMLANLRAGYLEEIPIELEVAERTPSMELAPGMMVELNLQDMMGGLLPQKTKKRRVPVKEARRILEQEEANKLIDNDDVHEEAIRLAERSGIIFIDEIDKIAGGGGGSGPDVSREGVQRDILPLVEGTSVSTKYGMIKTDYILFIAAGAFHVSKINDLIPELQGRFPVKVTLDSLTKEDFKRILTQPDNAVTKQYTALLEVDHVRLEFTEEALDAVAEYASLMNEKEENIGARRLHTILERLLEDVSFHAGGDYPTFTLTIDGEYVRKHLAELDENKDFRRYIL